MEALRKMLAVIAVAALSFGAVACQAEGEIGEEGGGVQVEGGEEGGGEGGED